MSFPNKTAEHFYKSSCIVFFLGSPNYWIEDLKLPKTFLTSYRSVSRFLNIYLIFFVFLELGSFITQKNLSMKQESDLKIYGISHPVLISYSFIFFGHQPNIKKLIIHILSLKNIYNDEKVEQKMLKKSKRDSGALAFSCLLAVGLHTASAFMQFIKSEGTFTTVITAWPLVDDPSRIAHFARVFNNIIWWVLVSRVIASYITVIVLVTSVSHQFINLQSYFFSIEAVFKDKHLGQVEKEINYEKAFKLGIKLHSGTIECVDQFRHICNGIFSAQVVFVIATLVFLMTQMMESERTMVTAAATFITATAVLIGAGFFLWNAGDITVESGEVATAMYCSGWQHCTGGSANRVRKLLTIAMTRAQKPVVIKGLGMMTLSYQSYLSLVKSSYSVFSVIY